MTPTHSKPTTVDPMALPKAACDCHTHVIDASVATYPMVTNRSYTPEPAPEPEFLAHLAQLGCERAVVVQISVYGTDNRVLLNTLRRHPKRLRGVVVLDHRVTDAELLALHQAGVRGVRFNLLYAGGVALNELSHLAPRLAALGWHAELLVDIRELASIHPRLTALPIPCVFAHFGHFPAVLGPRHTAFRELLAFCEHHEAWVKLSAPYRLADDPPYTHTQALAEALLSTLPHRLLWGSDWPHVATKAVVHTPHLNAQIERWLPDHQSRQQVLVENPARLYQFAEDPA